jgi:hypothetical protein
MYSVYYCPPDQQPTGWLVSVSILHTVHSPFIRDRLCSPLEPLRSSKGAVYLNIFSIYDDPLVSVSEASTENYYSPDVRKAQARYLWGFWAMGIEILLCCRLGVCKDSVE